MFEKKADKVWKMHAWISQFLNYLIPSELSVGTFMVYATCFCLWCIMYKLKGVMIRSLFQICAIPIWFCKIFFLFFSS
jgi:membrane protein YdbS with pleckstrin-like domain